MSAAERFVCVCVLLHCSLLEMFHHFRRHGCFYAQVMAEFAQMTREERLRLRFQAMVRIKMIVLLTAHWSYRHKSSHDSKKNKKKQYTLNIYLLYVLQAQNIDDEDLDDLDALRLIHFLGKDFKERTVVYLSGPNLLVRALSMRCLESFCILCTTYGI